MIKEKLFGYILRSRVRRRSHSPLSRRVREKLEQTPDPPEESERRRIAAIGLRRPRYRSRSCSPPSSTSQTAPEKKFGTGKKRLYMFVGCGGPSNDHLLYEVEIPAFKYTNTNEISTSLLHTTSEPPIYPIHGFEFGKYPPSMSCVQLGTTLYFLGGSLVFYNLNEFSQKVDSRDANWYDTDKIRNCDVFEYFPRDVHIYDTKSRNFLSNSVPQMHSGKYGTYAFVAGGKIYVIGSNPKINVVLSNDYKLSCFECFDLVTQEWSVLPDPISDSFVVGHVVKDNSIYLLDFERNMYRFNLEKYRWYRVDSLHNCNRNFVKGAVYIENKMYAIRRIGSAEFLAAYGTLIPSGSEGEAFWDSELSFDSSLVHLDSNILCYVCMKFVEEDTNFEEDTDRDSDIPKPYRGSATKFEVKVNIFGVPGRIFAQESADGVAALFQGEHYYEKTIIGGRKCDTDLSDVRVKASFLVDYEE